MAGKLVRKETLVREAWRLEVGMSGPNGCSLSFEESGTGREVMVYLDAWQVRDLARACIKRLQERRDSAQQLLDGAKEA